MPVFLWGGTDKFLEQAVEIRVVLKAQIECHIFYLCVAFHQGQLRMLDFFPVDILQRGCLYLVPEQTYEVVLGQTRLLRQFGDGQIPVDVLVDV